MTRAFAVLVVTLASAVAAGLAFPAPGWWWLGWVAYAPLLVCLRCQRTTARALGLAWLWLTAFAWTVGSWLPRAVVTYYEQSPLLGAAFFFGVSSGMAGLQYMAFAALYRLTARSGSPATPLLAAAAWVVADLARVELWTGCPWGLPGYAQVDVAPVAAIAAFTGVYGVTFTVIATNAALAESWLAWREGMSTRRLVAQSAPVAIVMAAVLAVGSLQLRSYAASGTGTVRVAAVQPDVDLGAQWSQALYGENLSTYLDLTDSVLARERPAIVVWPEGAMSFFAEHEPVYRRAIAHVAGPRGAQILAGGPHTAGDEPRRYYNSAFLLAPEGAVVARYDKRHLLPFAEYFPFGTLALLRREFGRVREFDVGPPSPPLPTVAGPAGVMICNETFYPGIAAARALSGATWLVVIANDSWVQDPQFSRMVFDMARMRAIEQRRWLVRASTWGPSAIVDPFGRIVAAAPEGARTAVAAAIWPDASSTTPYAVLGDAFGWVCVAVVALASLRRRAWPARQ